MNCVNDFTPIILAVALQIPAVTAAIIAWLKYHSLMKSIEVKDVTPPPDK